MEPKEGAGDVGGDAGHGEAPSDAARKEPDAAEAQKEATDHAAEAKAEANDEHKAAQDKAEKAEKVDEDDKAGEKPRRALPLPPPPQDGSFATTAGVIALVILLGGVLLSVFVMRRSDAEKKQATPDKKAHNKRGGDHKKDAPAPWQIGQKVPVNITVIPDDVDILECGSPTAITGKHCAYESKETLWSKADGGDPKDDKTLLRPYSTTARQKLLGAGMWSQLKQPLPTKRFVVKCTFDVEAKIQKPLVRFAKGKEFHEVKDGWFAGALTGCSVVPPKN